MIFVTVGGRTESFSRLIEPMDHLAAETDEPVVMQIGHTTYRPRHAEYFAFTSGHHMEELTRTARVQVCHAGSGSIQTALKLGTPLVIVPRLHQFGECTDNHQLELTGAIEEREQGVAVMDVTVQTLQQAIERAVQLSPPPPNANANQQMLVKALRKHLQAFALARDKEG